MELAASLSSRLKHHFPATLVFDHPSVPAMAQHLLEALSPANRPAPMPPVPPTTHHLAAGSPGLDISLTGISRLPGQEEVLGWMQPQPQDAITHVPFSRWDLEPAVSGRILKWWVSVITNAACS